MPDLQHTRFRRRTARPDRDATLLHQMPFGQQSRPFAPISFVSDDQIAAIHHAALRVLSETGMRVLEPAARAVLGRAGAQVSGEMVRLDPVMVTEHLRTVPASLPQSAGACTRMVIAAGAGLSGPLVLMVRFAQ